LRQPIRVIIDSQNRLLPSQKLFSLPGKVLLARTQADEALWPEQVRQLRVPAQPDGQLDLTALMTALAAEDINHLWVEAGAGLAGALLNA
ncbi:dihydrofolate reductase family protein, partial [Photobacterium sp. R1]